MARLMLKENRIKNVIKRLNPKKKVIKSSYLIILGIFFLAACQQNNFYFEEVAKVGSSWKSTDTKKFTVPVKNPDQEFTMYFILRNNSEYEYSNIYVFTELKSPKGERVVDTLEYQLAYPTGEWMGFGMGDIKQNTLVYKEKIALKDTGVYEINVAQAMRENDLIGIEDISLMIEKN